MKFLEPNLALKRGNLDTSNAPDKERQRNDRRFVANADFPNLTFNVTEGGAELFTEF
jgi:hypothetical protein